MLTAQLPGRRMSWLALLAAGCQSPAPLPPPAPLHAPALEIISEQFTGSLLSGAKQPEAHAAAAETETEEHPDMAQLASESLLVDCSLLYLEDSPLLGRKPLAAQVDLVADLRGSQPVLSSAALGAEAEVLVGPGAVEFLSEVRADGRGRYLVLCEASPALPRGTTFALDALGHERVRDPLDFLDEFPDRGPIPRRVGLRIERPGPDGPLLLALVLQDLDPEIEIARLAAAAEAGSQIPEPPGPAEKEDVRMELLRLKDGYTVDQGPIILLVPSPFRGGNGETFAFALEPNTQATAAVRQAAAKRAEQALQRSFEASSSPAPNEEQARDIETEAALVSLSNGAQRSALLLLAQRARAPLTSDLVLTASKQQLQALTDRFFDDQSPAEVAQDAAAVPMRLERASYSMLLEAAADESLSPDLQALLYMRTGALGPFPDAVQGALQQARNIEDLEATWISENLSFLEDSDPSARLRAHDWLQARELAIPNYDPLANRKQRRAALEAMRIENEAEVAQ